LVDRSNLAGQILVNQDEDQNKTDIANDFKKPMNSLLDFEKKILEPIKSLDEILKGLATGKMNQKELNNYSEIMEDNAALSNQRGFKVLAKMHMIVASAFSDIVTGSLIVDKTVIEALRACLIVIVAVVKKKQVDISGYLNRSEEFARKYLKNSIQV
jgi:flagellar biosynthesis regulator FlaF